METVEVTGVKTFLAHPGARKNLCFVKVETDEGIYGWGECYTQADRDVQIAAHVAALERYLVGRDPMHIKHFMQVAYDDFATRRGAMDLYCALSGLEQAMWDIAGKKLGAPVYMLLRGRVPRQGAGVRERVVRAREYAGRACGGGLQGR